METNKKPKRISAKQRIIMQRRNPKKKVQWRIWRTQQFERTHWRFEGTGWRELTNEEKIEGVWTLFEGNGEYGGKILNVLKIRFPMVEIWRIKLSILDR